MSYVYSPAHYWLSCEVDGSYRVGLTRFATRMLGELVDGAFDIKVGASLNHGQIVGWIEGFKAISDLYGVVEGNFVEVNPVLRDDIGRVGQDPYLAGWLYRATGIPDRRCMSVQDYASLLDKTIDKLLEKSANEEIK